MAESPTTNKSAADDNDESAAIPAGASATAVSSKAQSPVQIALRVLIGFGGLALLVGFFLPWLNLAGAGEAAGTMEVQSGLTLATSGVLVGTPAPLLFAVPGLGIALTAIAFMGFRWSAQVAVGASVALIGYAVYVLLQMFVQHTAIGLWIVAGSVFVILVLGVIAWMTGREPRQPTESPLAESAKP